MYLLANHDLSYGCQTSATDVLAWDFVSLGSSCTDSSCESEETSFSSYAQNEADVSHQASTAEVGNFFEVIKESFKTFIAYVYRSVTRISSLVRIRQLSNTKLYHSALFVLYGAELRL